MKNERLKKLEKKVGLHNSPLNVILVQPGDNADELVSQWESSGHRTGPLIILNTTVRRDILH